MPSLADITTALELVEDAVLAALGTAGHWGVAPPDTIEVLRNVRPATGSRRWVLVAQHQDGGGERSPLVGSNGWAGLVVVRAMGRTDADARAGYAAAVAAMAGLDSPAGYSLQARWDKPIALPTRDYISTRAGQWAITLRRTM